LEWERNGSIFVIERRKKLKVESLIKRKIRSKIKLKPVKSEKEKII